MNSTDSALPSSRQQVPMSPEIQEEIDRRGRSVAQLQRDIAARTERLSANIDELVSRVSPQRLAKDGAAGLKASILTDQGRPRPELIGALAGAALAVGFLVWRARRN